MKSCCRCGNNNLVVKSPPTCKKCYNKNYKRKTENCKQCGKTKEIHTKNGFCDSCYRKTYNPPGKKCYICGKINAIKKNSADGPVCRKCYKVKNYCGECGKYREICSQNLCRNCYNKNKRKHNKIFHITLLLRQRLYIALKNYSIIGKIRKADEYGINYNKIIDALKPFPENMEEYNIDHIFPLSAFDFNNPEEIKLAFAPENHQWLKKEDNFKKNAKYNRKDFLEYIQKGKGVMCNSQKKN